MTETVEARINELLAARPDLRDDGYTYAGRLDSLSWLNLLAAVMFAMGVTLVIVGLVPVLPSRPGVFMNTIWVIPFVLVGTLVVHESLHYLALVAYGHSASAGVDVAQLVAYIRPHDDQVITRTEHLVVLIAPTVGLSLLTLGGYGLLAAEVRWIAALAFTSNLFGASDDLASVAQMVLETPPGTVFCGFSDDDEDVTHVFVPVDDETAVAPEPDGRTGRAE